MDSRLHDQDRPALERRIKHYSNLHQILLVGEGDFSFSAALANAFGSAENMVPTSLHSRVKIIRSYGSGQNNLRNLEKRGATILHGVDARTMSKLEIMKERKFDRIVFNFPHAGFPGNQNNNKIIKQHRRLLKMFFKNGMTMLNRMGEIHVTHKVKDPYDKWKLVKQAEKCGLLLKESVKFDKADYPGYTNRRGAGPRIGRSFFLGECRTYMFIPREFMTTPTMLPKISSQGHLESLKAAILELETERKNRKAAETAKENLESSFNDLRTVADKTLKERDEFRWQKDEALRKKEKITKQLAEACWETDHALRQKEKIAKQLYEALRLKEVERDEFRRQRHNALHQKYQVRTDKENITKQLAEALRLKMEETDGLRRQIDSALHQKDKVLRDKENMAKQLAEALRLKREETDELRRQIDAALHQKDEVSRDKENMAKQLAEVLRLKKEETDELRREIDSALYQKDKVSRDKENMAKQVAEVLRLKKEETDELRRQIDSALHQKDKVSRDKEKVAKQLAEALRLKEEEIDELRRQIVSALHQKDKVSRDKENMAKQLAKL